MTDDNLRIWRVVSVYSDGRRHAESSWMPKGAAELLAEDLRLYREENPPLDGSDEPSVVVERAGRKAASVGTA